MESVETFDTVRLSATRICERDFDDLFRLNQDPEIAKTMAGTRPASETREFIRTAVEHWKCHGYGFWIFRERTNVHFIGRGGLRHVDIDGRPEIEIAYAVMPKFWRRGFATEMARAMVEVARKAATPELVAFTLPTNLGSRGVMERIGFRYERDIIWASLPHVLYRMKL
jgi:ribosomal-protein-alanine N-acetyltransferase